MKRASDMWGRTCALPEISLICFGIFESRDGRVWLLNEQTGWREMNPNTRTVRFARLARLARRHGRKGFLFEGLRRAA